MPFAALKMYANAEHTPYFVTGYNVIGSDRSAITARYDFEDFLLTDLSVTVIRHR